MKQHIMNWVLAVIIVLLLLRVVEGYMMKPEPLTDINIPLNIQDTITGDKKYTYM